MSNLIYERVAVSQLYGDDNYQSIEDNITNHRAFIERIPEIGIIVVSNILSNQSKSFNLANQGINSPIMVRSIYAFNATSTNDEIDFNIYETTGTGTNILVAQQTFTKEEMPVGFPYGIVLFPNNIIEIIPSQDLTSVRLFCCPVKVMFEAVVA